MSEPRRRASGVTKAKEPKAARGPEPAQPLSLRHPGVVFVALLAAAGCVVSVSFQLIDTDFWQHLLVGKAIWQLHRVPLRHLWTWANYGTPEVLPSWGFRALIWPVWRLGGVPGLFAWRWATTLLAFGLMWAAARRMGARGLTPLVIIVWCSLLYRNRSQIRPETLVAVLMALEIWILETRRPRPFGGGGPDRSWWLVPIAWAWVNSHISYFLLFLLLAFHIADDQLRAWRARRGGAAGLVAADPRRLWLVFVAAAAVGFLNPFGWQALWQPFDYLLRLRNEPMFRGIGELQPLSWLNNRTNGVFLMLVLWPVLALWRTRRHGMDLAEALTCAFFTWYMASSQRFLGSYALVAAPYLARDFEDWLHARPWPAWTARPWPRVALAACAVVAVGAAEWARPERPLRISVEMKQFPVQAYDFVARHGIRGHGFSQTRVAGYQLWRFWPDSTRLPFMDIHQTGSVADRTLYTEAILNPGGWSRLDRGDRFDYVVLHTQYANTLLNALDADTTMVLVFLDDTGALYVRPRGPLRAVADSFGYRLVGAGDQKTSRAFFAAAADSGVRTRLRAELARLAASSPLDARALSLIGTFAFDEQRFEVARVALERALRVDPRTPLAHFRLASIALMESRPREATAHFQQELRLFGPEPGIEFGLGMACRMAGDAAGARSHLEREIKRFPGNASARAAEDALSESTAR